MRKNNKIRNRENKFNSLTGLGIGSIRQSSLKAVQIE
jgi:hypothetical protein